MELAHGIVVIDRSPLLDPLGLAFDCLASITFPGWRQLFLPFDDNYLLGLNLQVVYTGCGRGRG
jgi:hypothetical protein